MGLLPCVFPGKLFSLGDPLVRGNMAMLQAAECQGALLGTGWLADGIWAYFASSTPTPGSGWATAGRQPRSFTPLPIMRLPALWREEQMPRGKGDRVVGDIPHNWASAEFIRLVRHLLVLERGNDCTCWKACRCRASPALSPD